MQDKNTISLDLLVRSAWVARSEVDTQEFINNIEKIADVPSDTIREFISKLNSLLKHRAALEQMQEVK